MIRGLYVSRVSVLVKAPAILPMLIEKMGLNLLILYGPVALPPDVRARNPLPEAVASREGPGVRFTEDDRDLRACIALARRHDLQVWLLLSSWWDNAQHAPDLVAQDVWGESLLHAAPHRYATEQHMGLPYCPSRPQVQEWFTLLYRAAVQQYAVDGLDLTHARFPHPAFVQSLWSCACADCVRAGADLGFDVPALASAIRQFVDNVPTWNPKQMGLNDADARTPLDVAGIPGLSLEVREWFQFRAALITSRLADLSMAVKDAVTHPVSFIVDGHVPTFAPLAGHRYADWPRFSDAASPLLSHLGSHYLDNFASLSEWIRARVPELDEAAALQFVYRLFGYQQFGLPASIAALGVQERTGQSPTDEESSLLPQLQAIILHELRQARALTPAGLPSYPVIMGEVWPSYVVRQLAQQALDLGHDGVIFQGTSALTGSLLGLW